MLWKRSLLASSALLAAVLASGAHAQTRPAAQAVAGNTIEELVVTAQRREQSLQDVPVAVTAFSARQRDIIGISTVQDITNFTPGLTYSSQLDRPVIRGLARNNNIYLSDSAVAVYYDDFFSNSTYLVGRDDMLIDQVEVLLGPQGTLYGRNAVGGLINTISKRPTEDLGGEVRFIAGNYGYTKIEGTVSGPVPGVKDLYFRLSAYDLNQTEGYFKNLTGPSEGDVRHDPYVDAQLEYKTDKDDIWLDAYAVWFNNDRGGPGGLLGIPTAGHYDTSLTQPGQLVFNPNFPFGGGAVPGSVRGIPTGLTDNPALRDIRTFAHAVPTDIVVNAAPTITLHWTHHFDGFDIKYIGGYSQYHYNLHTAYFNNDNSPVTSFQVPIAPGGTCSTLGPACAPLTVNPRQIFQYEAHPDWSSHEFNIASTGEGPFQWIAGVYRYDERDNNPETFQEPDQAQIASPLQVIPLLGAGQLVPAPANPSRNYLLLNYQDHIESTAVFGQIDWQFTEQLKLTAGLRYTYDAKHGQEEARYIVFQDLSPEFSAENLGALLQAVDITPTQISQTADKGTCSAPSLQTTGKYAGDYVRCLKDHSSAVTGTVGLSWTPDKNTLVYGRYNRGYKAFGFNAGFIGSNVEATPEYVDDFELGFKKSWSRFTLDAAAFHYDYQDAQIPIGVPVGAVTVTEFVNIPKAISEGIEITAVWAPIDNLNLSLVYGLDHTRIQSGCSLVNNVAVGACFVDIADPGAAAIGARPVGPALGGSRPQAVSGDELPQAPENKVAFNANYAWRFDPGTLTLSGSYIWKDKSYASIFRRDYDSAPSWNQVDLRLTWQGQHDKYELVAYVRNLFDTLGYDAAAAAYPIAAPVGGGAFTQAPGYDLTPPRTYGFEVHYKF